MISHRTQAAPASSGLTRGERRRIIVEQEEKQQLGKPQVKKKRLSMEETFEELTDKMEVMEVGVDDEDFEMEQEAGVLVYDDRSGVVLDQKLVEV